MKYSIFSIFILAFLTVSLPVSAQKKNPWAARETCIFGMPYIGHAVKQGRTGTITEILKAVYEPEDVVLEHKALPYERTLSELMTGKIHCTLDVKDNRKGVLQGKSTIAIYDLSAAYMRTTEFKGVQSLKDTRVAFLHGFAIDNFLPVKFTPQQVYDLTSAFHMLDSGHVAFVLGDTELLKTAIYESKLVSADFSITAIKSFDVRPVFAPTDEGRRFRTMYDRRMRELLDSGELEEVMRKAGTGEKGIKKVLEANKQ